MIPVLKQFFDRNTLYGIGALLAVHITAWFTQHTVWSAIPFAIIVIGALIITKRSLVWGLAFAMLEIFVGGHGHLIDVSIGGTALGIRQGIFLAVMLGTLYHVVVNYVRPRFVAERDVPFVFLAVAIALGTISGFARNSVGAAFDDMNGYATFAYLLPVAMIVWTPEAKRVLLWTFALAATWVASSSLVFLFLFTHLSADGVWALYKFARDARLLEATMLSGPAWLVSLLPNGAWYFRVFEQGQFIVMMFTVLLCGVMMFVTKSWRERFALLVPMALMFAVDIGGQSRSFWLGLLVSLFLFGMVFLRERPTIQNIVRMKTVGMLAILVAVMSLWLVVVFPVPSRPDFTTSPFYRGQNDSTRDLAVSSRWNLLGPMMTEIGKNPLWGSGFGTSVTYISDDPRLRAVNGTGEWTTYRFEWGYQDIWLKMGVPGLLAFGFYLVTILRAGYRSVVEREETRWLTLSMACGVIALYVAHVFSPYLNHPIGLGFMVFVLPFFTWRDMPLPTMESLKDRIPSASIAPMQKAATVRER